MPEGASPEIIDGASPAVIHFQVGGADLSSGTFQGRKKNNPVPAASAKKPTSELKNPPEDLNFTHWQHGKLIRSGVNPNWTNDGTPVGSDVAASASNPIYESTYGAGDGSDDGDDEEVSSYDGASDADYCPKSFELDDDDFVDLDPVESEDKQ